MEFALECEGLTKRFGGLEALQVASRITVLHLGGVFAEGSPGEIRNNREVQEIYFGAEE